MPMARGIIVCMISLLCLRLRSPPYSRRLTSLHYIFCCWVAVELFLSPLATAANNGLVRKTGVSPNIQHFCICGSSGCASVEIRHRKTWNYPNLDIMDGFRMIRSTFHIQNSSHMDPCTCLRSRKPSRALVESSKATSLRELEP